MEEALMSRIEEQAKEIIQLKKDKDDYIQMLCNTNEKLVQFRAVLKQSGKIFQSTVEDCVNNNLDLDLCIFYDIETTIETIDKLIGGEGNG